LRVNYLIKPAVVFFEYSDVALKKRNTIQVMKKKILIVEDQFIEANNLQMIIEKVGYAVCGIAKSVQAALDIEIEKPDLVLLDIFLQGPLTGIDLA
jgi:PleD family two-component response regulator